MVITAVGGYPAGSPANLTGMLARYRPGDTISLTGDFEGALAERIPASGRCPRRSRAPGAPFTG